LVLNGKLPKNSVICEFGANSLYAVKDFASFVAGLYPELLTTIEFLIVEKNPEVAKKQRVDLEDFFEI
jgi:SAM-dependent MidA family methyltransferase